MRELLVFRKEDSRVGSVSSELVAGQVVSQQIVNVSASRLAETKLSLMSPTLRTAR